MPLFNDTKLVNALKCYSLSRVYYSLVTKETQWADPRIAYHLQQQNEKALPVSVYRGKHTLFYVLTED